jgi:uncharacterized membrane protein YkvA (DUF1232 family)
MFDRIKSLQRSLKGEIRTYQLVMKDPRTPRMARWLLATAIGYALLPFDIIPDFIPVIGHLDDIIIVPLLVFLSLRLIPPEVIQECRTKAQDNLQNT